MSVLLLLQVTIAVASFAGTVMAFVVAGLPPEVLLYSAVGRRYGGLGAGERTSPVGPSSGRRIPARAAVQGAGA